MGDNTSVPLALAARYQVNRELGLVVAFALPRLVAPKTTPRASWAECARARP